MREHIVADEQLLPTVALGDFLRSFFVEVGSQRWDGILARDGGHVAGRLDTEHLNAPRGEELQQRTVVRAGFDDQVVGSEAELLYQLIRIFAAVIDPGRGRTRHIGIMVMIMLFGGKLMRQLRQSARLANGDLQRIRDGRNRSAPLPHPRQAVGNWLLS